MLRELRSGRQRPRQLLHHLTSTGNGFLVSAGGVLNPVGSLSTPTALGLGDDTSVLTTSGLTVHSNGFVSFGAGNGNGFTPTVATFLNDPAAAIRTWHDFNPAAAGSGQVQYEEVVTANGFEVQVTWDGVFDFGGSIGNTEFEQVQRVGSLRQSGCPGGGSSGRILLHDVATAPQPRSRVRAVAPLQYAGPGRCGRCGHLTMSSSEP